MSSMTRDQLAGVDLEFASRCRRLRDLLNDLRSTYDIGDQPTTLARRAQLREQIDALRAVGTPILAADEIRQLPT